MLKLVKEKENELLETQVFNHEMFGDIRTLVIENEPWFVGKDMAIALGYKNTSKALKDNVDEEDKGVTKITTFGGTQNATVINESGMYSLVFGSKLKSAKQFKHWVTSEVLPALRKTGSYNSKPQNELYMPDGSLNLMLFKQVIDQAIELEEQVKILEPKAEYTDKVLKSENLISTTTIAKEYGMSAREFNKLLNEIGVQYKQDNHWVLYQKYANQGYTGTKTYTYIDVYGKDQVNIHTYWTSKGRYFLYELLKEHDIIPLVERREITVVKSYM